VSKDFPTYLLLTTASVGLRRQLLPALAHRSGSERICACLNRLRHRSCAKWVARCLYCLGLRPCAAPHAHTAWGPHSAAATTTQATRPKDWTTCRWHCLHRLLCHACSHEGARISHSHGRVWSWQRRLACAVCSRHWPSSFWPQPRGVCRLLPLWQRWHGRCWHQIGGASRLHSCEGCSVSIRHARGAWGLEAATIVLG